MSASAVRPTRSTSGAPSSSDASDDDKLGAESVSPETAARTLTGFNGNRRVPPPVNESIKTYAPGSPERAELKARLHTMSNERADIPLIIGGNEVHTGALTESVMPHNHRHVLASWHRANPEHVDQAVKAAQAAAKDWANWSWEDRAAVFLKAAELLATTWRATLNAATMLGQSKTAFQAEIDAACELIDFWRFNPHYAQSLYDEQPLSDRTMWNQLDYRPLEGFVYAVTPFNFTSIAGNLPTAPALMGNTVVWKPASSAMLSAYYLMKLLEEAGLPPGVINFVPGDAGMISDKLLSNRDLAGVHFTGSTAVFNSMWKTIGASMSRYKSYPRIVGETGGKDFIVAHPSADPAALSVAIARGGFEYQGQKCSAASRVYIPESIWPEVRDRTVAIMRDIKMGDVTDFRNFMGAVIDKKAFIKIGEYLDHGHKNATVISGGVARGEDGYFIEPTLIETKDPGYRLLCEEIFGPVVTVHVYPDSNWAETLKIVDETSPYALTGAVFSRDRQAIRQAALALRNAAGNFYINDKPTGAVVGQQPFGGARGSGTNDKAGSKLNLVRWISPRNIKETFSPPTDYRYPFMAEE
ncbi:MAG: 1-pyrroline-5-carboxylate dehydrogenase [Gemmatimonadaceae bacterium]|jgi:1-pyrroline-5-carboxylate dehydrogenase|nr:1-pyrroline-5-carboxylate dehydrogenase [Gemmatimonadaceae bacterium]